MSLGHSSDVEQDVLDALSELGKATSVEVAYWRVTKKRKPTMGGCAVGLTMMLMELQNRLRFTDHHYEVTTK